MTCLFFQWNSSLSNVSQHHELHGGLPLPLVHALPVRRVSPPAPEHLPHDAGAHPAHAAAVQTLHDAVVGVAHVGGDLLGEADVDLEIDILHFIFKKL